ncbi:hypothetical protein SAMN05428997_12534 [Bosea sp. CRIB-10]|uniref:hypothetical protein n=1 Tax=Bosea sp. CRIB-10 TaxID=378404 RepID=UPI0008F132EC|nr:hypothetical protein [Bosea sp. CRIB-10]SFD34390.1 hypothetical protein SAMN05428997_12534 [Bosea sp. CRIB-10]
MTSLKPCLVVLAAVGLAGCVVTGPMPGTPEFTASQVSRAYDCGLRVDRGRIIARLPAEQRGRFVSANASYAVKSYNAPRRCDDRERNTIRNSMLDLGSAIR